MRLILINSDEKCVVTGAEIGPDEEHINQIIEMIIMSFDYRGEENATIIYKSYRNSVPFVRYYMMDGSVSDIMPFDPNEDGTFNEIVYWRGHINKMKPIFSRIYALKGGKR